MFLIQCLLELLRIKNNGQCQEWQNRNVFFFPFVSHIAQDKKSYLISGKNSIHTHVIQDFYTRQVIASFVFSVCLYLQVFCQGSTACLFVQEAVYLFKHFLQFCSTVCVVISLESLHQKGIRADVLIIFTQRCAVGLFTYIYK